MKRFFALLALSSVLFTGCSSLFPKKVEFFQDKVEKFPVTGVTILYIIQKWRNARKKK